MKVTRFSKLREFLVTTAQGRSYLVASSTVGLILLVLLLGIAPSLDAVSRQYSDNERKQIVLDQLNQKLATLDNLVVQERQNAALAQAIGEVVPDNAQEEAVLVLLNKLARERGLTIRTVTFSPIEKNRKLAQLFGANNKLQAKIVNLVVDGNSNELIDFLRAVEESKRIFNVRSFSLQRNQQQVGVSFAGQYSLTLIAETFYWDNSLKTSQ